jgi:hypothetical protein
VVPSISTLTMILAFGTVVFVSMEAIKAVLRKKLQPARTS